MKSQLFVSIALLFFYFGVREADLYLADKTYPDLGCHKGYDIDEGKRDAEAATKECNERVKNFTKANVCFERCILHWIGVLNKTSWTMRSIKEIATEFVKYAFREDKVGRVVARKLATNIYVSCNTVLEEVKQVSSLCKDWGPVYECVDNAWKCVAGRGLSYDENDAEDIDY